MLSHARSNAGFRRHEVCVENVWLQSAVWLGLALFAFAQRLTAELDMICVEELPRLPASIGEVREERAEAGRMFRRVIERAREQAQASGVVFDAHVVSGHAVTSIVEFVERGRYDLLVVGYLGHSALYNRLIGSTTDRLVELAPRKVLVVK
jgi:nucleotide-binding universal stress UspA family protein